MQTAFATGWRQLRAEPRRHFFPFLTLALGVAMLFGTLLSAETASSTVSKGIDSLTTFGEVGIVPAPGSVSIDQKSLAAVEHLDGVRRILPTFSGATVGRGSGKGSPSMRLTVTGYPEESNPRLTSLVDSGYLPTGSEHDVLLPTDVASRLGLQVGDELLLASADGQSSFVVSGLADPELLGVFAQDNVFVALDQAQGIFSAEGQLTRIDLELDPSAETWSVAHAAALPVGTKFQDTRAAESALEPVQRTLTLVLALCAVIVLAISGLLAGIAFRSAVESRRTTFGLLRTVGASGVWLARSILTEALLVAGAGTVCGLALGYAGSWISRAVASISTSRLTEAPQPPALLVVGCGLAGLLFGLIGASRAVLQVVKSPPMSSVQHRPRLWRGTPWISGLSVLVVTGVGLVSVGISLPTFDILGFLAFCVSCLLAAPLCLRSFAILAKRLRGWRASAVGHRNAQERSLAGPASMTAVVICAATSLCIGIGAIGSAMEAQVSRQFGADVQATTSVPVTDDTTHRLRSLKGVALVSPTVSSEVRLSSGGTPLDVSFLAVDPATYFEVAQLPWRIGHDQTTPRDFAAGDAVILPVAVAESLGVRPGSRVTVARGEASESLRVVGTFSSLATGDQIIVGRHVAQRLGVSGTSGWNIQVTVGHDVGATRHRVAEEFDSIPGSEVVTGTAMKSIAITQLAAYSSVVFIVVAVALVFGAIGASTVLATDVARRKREFAILRAVGASPRDILALVFGGTGLVVVAASVTGLLAGWPAGVLLTRIIGRSLGVAITPSLPPVFLAATLAMTSIALVVASVVPGRRAAHTSAADALREE